MGASMGEFSLPEICGGLNLRDLPYKIDETQSPDMQNMWYRDRVLSKRWGQDYALPALDGTVWSISAEFEGMPVIHAGTKLYRWDIASGQVLDIASGIADRQGTFLEFNSALYHLDGAEIRQVYKNEDNYTAEPIKPYEPTIYMNCAPDFSASTPDEAFNLIGAGFKVKYCGDGKSAVYTLPHFKGGLDSTSIRISINGGEDLKRGTDYIWEDGAETVRFIKTEGTDIVDSPPEIGTDNVEITAYKTVAGAKQMIVGCKVAIAFGGESSDIAGGTRAFLMGNDAYPRTYWYSDLGGGQSGGMAYFPDNQYEDLIQNNEAITAAAKQAGELIIFKERSLFVVSYEFDGQDVYYPLREFNSAIGCDMPGTVQLIDNRLVFANTSGGVYMIASTEGKAEDNVKPLSGNINGTRLNPGLLRDDFDVAWTAADETWTYESISSFSIIGDKTGKYQKGDKIKLTQNGIKKFYRIAGISYDSIKQSVLQLSGEVALIGDAISEPCYSYDVPLRASSIDYDRKYWLCVGDRVYLWDYELTPYYGYADYEKAQRRLAWFRQNNINAGTWYGKNRLFYGQRGSQRVIKFTDAYSDFGKPIEAYWVSRAFDFGEPNYLKTVDRVYVSLRTDTNCAVTFDIKNEKRELHLQRQLEARSFRWHTFDWKIFTWDVLRYSKPFEIKARMKNIIYCQLKISNNENFKDMGLTDLKIHYYINKTIKR